MSRQFTREQLQVRAEIVAAPQRHQTVVDRTFELPRRLYAATVALYLGFVGVLGIGFGNPEMIIPVAIFAVFIVAGFGVPAVWATMATHTASRSLSWSRFAGEGIATLTGRVKAIDAVTPVLILPVLIFMWGVAVLIIATLV